MRGAVSHQRPEHADDHNIQNRDSCNRKRMLMERESEGPGWLVLLPRVPAEPVRHRMALWRELRRAGAVPLGQATWAVPDVPAAHPLLRRLAELVAAAEGTLLVLDARGHDAPDAERLEQLYAEARAQEWAEFRADCAKYLAELDREEALGKYTLAELEEEEQSLDRLRRWYRDLRTRDLLTSPSAADAGPDLKTCEQRFDNYADHVYVTLASPLPS